MKNLVSEFNIGHKENEQDQSKSKMDSMQLEATLEKLIKHAIAYEAAKNKLKLL